MSANDAVRCGAVRWKDDGRNARARTAFRHRRPRVGASRCAAEALPADRVGSRASPSNAERKNVVFGIAGRRLPHPLTSVSSARSPIVLRTLPTLTESSSTALGLGGGTGVGSPGTAATPHGDRGDGGARGGDCGKGPPPPPSPPPRGGGGTRRTRARTSGCWFIIDFGSFAARRYRRMFVEGPVPAMLFVVPGPPPHGAPPPSPAQLSSSIFCVVTSFARRAGGGSDY